MTPCNIKYDRLIVINDLIVLAKPGGTVEFLNVEFNVGTMYIQYTMYIRCTFDVHSMYIQCAFAFFYSYYHFYVLNKHIALDVLLNPNQIN